MRRDRPAGVTVLSDLARDLPLAEEHEEQHGAGSEAEPRVVEPPTKPDAMRGQLGPDDPWPDWFF